MGVLPLLGVAALAALFLGKRSGAAQGAAASQRPATAEPSAPAKQGAVAVSRQKVPSQSVREVPTRPVDTEESEAVEAARLAEARQSSSVVQQTLPTQMPAGYDEAAAKASAQSVADHLRSRGIARYNRKSLASWQRKAGLSQDGLYGPKTEAALKFFGAKHVPRHFFKG